MKMMKTINPEEEVMKETPCVFYRCHNQEEVLYAVELLTALGYKDTLTIPELVKFVVGSKEGDIHYYSGNESLTLTAKQLYIPLWEVHPEATHYNLRTGAYLKYQEGESTLVQQWNNVTLNWFIVRNNDTGRTHKHIVAKPNKLPKGFLRTSYGVDTTVTKPVETYNHYVRHFKGVKLDPYRIFSLYEITDPCVQHAMKKLFALGKRGSKNLEKDLQEVIDTLVRMKEMLSE
jgi:hypothetical protein